MQPSHRPPFALRPSDDRPAATLTAPAPAGCPACGVPLSADQRSGLRMAAGDVPPAPDADGRFAGLVGPAVDPMLRVARRILDSDDLAWEAVQEALLGLWRRDDEPANPRAWLVRAVVHRSLHLRRTLRRRREHEARASRIRAESCDHDDPLRRLVAEESRSELRDALAGLAGNHRDVIALHMWEGLDYETIAGRLGVPIGTVRSRLNRARSALRAALARGREQDDREFGGEGRP